MKTVFWLCLFSFLQVSCDFALAIDATLPVRLPGLVGTFAGGSGVEYQRVDLRIHRSWKSLKELDERLNDSKSIRATWKGTLEIKAAGRYELHIYTIGSMTLKLDGRDIIAGDSTDGSWLSSPPLELDFGLHPLEISYQNSQPFGQIGLFWQGPGFDREPISERYLAHSASQSPNDDYQRGQLLSRGLRCTACHISTSGSDDELPPMVAPDLTRVEGNLRREWLVERLVAPPSTQSEVDSLADDNVSRRMPHFALTEKDAADIVEALWSASLPFEIKPRAVKEKKADSKTKDKATKRTQPDANEGRITFDTQGCLACHTLLSRSLGRVDTEIDASYHPNNRLTQLTQQLFAGGDLGDIVRKRPADFFSRWLSEPQNINTRHRMPVANLSDLQREDIAMYLQSLKGENNREMPVVLKRGDAMRGAQLIETNRCAACHQLPEQLRVKSIARTKLTPMSRWNSGCLDADLGQKPAIKFALTERQRACLKTYWSGKPSGQLDSGLLLAEKNCLACHARDAEPGIAPRATELVRENSELAARLPALLPPSLTGVGDKLHEAALKSSIDGSDSVRRNWLEIRMPRYRLQPTERDQLASHLISMDRMPDLPAGSNSSKVGTDVETRAAAGRLVTSEGFGCQSCHKIGSQDPPAVALNARGTDLTMIGNRIRHAWFDRWVRNPIRIVPRMEMPAIQLPVQGVLGSNLDKQIDAVWEMLNTEGFQPPSPSPVRVVRGHNRPRQIESAHVLSDVIETKVKKYLRPLVVGLGNRHNILFDLEKAQIAQWWIGDTARELTRGKSWYWEMGGHPLTNTLETIASFQLKDSQGQIWQCQAEEQFAAEFDGLQHTPQGVAWKGRMGFANQEKHRWVAFDVTVEPIVKLDQNGTTSSGAEIQFVFQVPSGFALQLVLESDLGRSNSKNSWVASVDEKSTVTLLGTNGTTSQIDPHTIQWSASGQSQQVNMRLETQWSLDEFIEGLAESSKLQQTLAKTEIDLVPGFDGLQLPLPRDEMPTALAWHKGHLIIGSLKGRVCRAVDTDRDGLADSWQPLSDDLPAPYGIASDNESIDVLAKYGLIRLSEPAPSKGSSATTPDLAWSQQVLADGWGYTFDYHDWAVGLPRDSQGNYYVGLPCQQDDRSPSAARLRGTVQKLIPQSPTSENPRSYRLETLSGGLRFPMGLALNHRGDLFASDNQGNYNPFNEINHIQSGKRYGFINKLENKPDFRPSLESPAVNLPHPWTRSVNGICFLNSPKNDQAFGPFEGHLIGCEYNELSLIRMSLDIIDGVYQGAAYPFSRPARSGEPSFEGPVTCAVSPDGDLYIGNIKDSGWGGGQNTGSVVRLHPHGQWPLGIGVVKAAKEGLTVEFTGKIDPVTGSKSDNYSLRSYRRISTPGYGGADQDEREEKILEAEVLPGDSKVLLKLASLRPDTVYELRVANVAHSKNALFPNEAHYTMKRVP